MTHKLRSEMSSQKINTTADVIFGSVTVLEGFVILDLKSRICILIAPVPVHCFSIAFIRFTMCSLCILYDFNLNISYFLNFRVKLQFLSYFLLKI